jgi:N-acetylglucosamine-6-sulfatase
MRASVNIIARVDRVKASAVNKVCALVVVALTVCLLASCSLPRVEQSATVTEASDRPNVILIVTDDQTLEDTRFMPNVQRLLAREGTTFKNAFVTDSLCCPARATILRGQYAHNHQVLGNELPLGGFQKFRFLGHEDSTVATWVGDGGYRTAFVGKYMNGYAGTHTPPGWDEWYAISGNYLSNDLNENGRVVSYDPERYHLDDVLAAKAEAYIGHAATGDRPLLADDRPFFMWLGTKAPHQPATPAPRHRGDFADVALPKGPSFDEEDVSDKPAWIRDNPRLDAQRTSYMERLYQKRLESLQAVDEMVARLVKALRTAEELDNTYIFFMSDNGFHLGEHRLGAGKWTAYEEDVRVPLIVRGPGVTRGAVREELVLDTDLAPTIAQIAGTQAPPFVDGRSLMPLLGGESPESQSWRSAFLIEAAAEFAGVPTPPFVDESSIRPLLTGDPLPEDWRRASDRGSWTSEDWGRPGLEAVRTQDYLYVEYENGDRELYDLREDPSQTENLLGGGADGGDPEVTGSLKERLGDLKGCAGVACREAEDSDLR